MMVCMVSVVCCNGCDFDDFVFNFACACACVVCVKSL